MMANDRADFEPNVRNSAWWSGDSRRAANGRAVDAILEKQGKKPLADLSDVEAVQMGHIMQPVIGRLFQDKHKIELKDADYAITHPKHDWMRSHFDFISADGACLVEAKNYNAGVRSRYDADANRIPDADFAQLVHESACHNINRIFLAVLFGGSEFVTIEFQITEDMKDDLVQRMAKLWAYCKTDTLPPAETIEQTKLVYPSSTDESIVATQNIEVVVAQLKQYKASIKALEDQSEALEVAIRNTMGDKSEIVSISGDTLVTWRSSKSSKRFSSDLFKQAMPDIYEQFVIEQPGSRRFLVK
jgi:predicted phage-related endonuclease